jgi:hypothetical protein
VNWQGGGTTLPRVPPPANQPIRTNKRTAECLECGRLFRLGLAVQVVSVSIKSFHPRALTLFHLSAASLIVFPKPIIPFIHWVWRVADSVLRLTFDSISARQ